MLLVIEIHQGLYSTDVTSRQKLVKTANIGFFASLLPLITQSISSASVFFWLQYWEYIHLKTSAEGIFLGAIQAEDMEDPTWSNIFQPMVIKKWPKGKKQSRLAPGTTEHLYCKVDCHGMRFFDKVPWGIQIICLFYYGKSVQFKSSTFSLATLYALSFSLQLNVLILSVMTQLSSMPQIMRHNLRWSIDGENVSDEGACMCQLYESAIYSNEVPAYLVNL